MNSPATRHSALSPPTPQQAAQVGSPRQARVAGTKHQAPLCLIINDTHRSSHAPLSDPASLPSCLPPTTAHTPPHFLSMLHVLGRANTEPGMEPVLKVEGSKYCTSSGSWLIAMGAPAWGDPAATW